MQPNTIPIKDIKLIWTCDKLGCCHTVHQPLTDLATVGTAVCPTCGDDMELTGMEFASKHQAAAKETIDRAADPTPNRGKGLAGLIDDIEATS